MEEGLGTRQVLEEGSGDEIIKNFILLSTTKQQLTKPRSNFDSKAVTRPCTLLCSSQTMSVCVSVII